MNDDQDKFLAYLASKGMLSNAGFNQQQNQAQQLEQFLMQAQHQKNVSNNLKSMELEHNTTVVKTTIKPEIQYKKMSLFDAPKNSIICHACNAQGVWGSGIAKEFKSLFPKAFEKYNQYCTVNLPYHTVGTTLITEPENTYRIGCLITSSDFGARLNAEQLILTHTKHALDKLAEKCPNDLIFYSNKFNSGFFKVPWEKTEQLIQDFVKKYNKTWVIADPNLKEK